MAHEIKAIDDAAKPSYSCCVCGSDAPKLCAGCKIFRYCTRECQVEDWKAGHKKACKTCKITSEKKAVIATISLDFDEILGAGNYLKTEQEKSMRFVTGVFIVEVDSRGVSGLATMSFVVTNLSNVVALGQAAKSLLDLIVYSLPKLTGKEPELSHVFRFDRTAETKASADTGAWMPLGVPVAAKQWADAAAKALRGMPRDTPFMARMQRLSDGLPASTPGDRRTMRPVSAAHTAERKRYDRGFENGAKEYYDYPTSFVPVGSRITVLHFTHGLYFRTVDFTACRRGLCAERIVALPTRAGNTAEVVDCRALRKQSSAAREQAEARDAAREAAKGTPKEGERADGDELD